MKKQLFKQFVSLLLIMCMVLAYAPTAKADSVTWKETDQQITAERTDRLVKNEGRTDRDPKEIVRVSIVLEAPSTVGAGYATMGIASNSDAMAYRDELLEAQKRMEKTISRQALNGRPLDVVWNMTLVGNIISARVPYGSLEKIAAVQGVKTVAMEAQYEPAVVERNIDLVPTVYPSGGMIGSGHLWNSGYTGAGSRIAIVDTGTDRWHQSFDNGAYLYALRKNAEAKGMSYEAYISSLDLLDTEEIASVLPRLNAFERSSGLSSAALYNNEKHPFGFNYVDGDLHTDHMNDQQGEHGSHVAGIATANRYIPQADGSYADARDSVLTLGVAPDAQLITMKVFGQTSPYDSDYMAAIEDAILLNCDVVNLSLGTTMPGSPYTDVYYDLMEMLKETDTVVVISAGNAGNWAAATMFGYLYNDDVSFDAVGAPGSYESAFTVASVDNSGTVGFFFEAAGQKVFYAETQGYGNTSMVTLDTSANASGTVYDYIFLDGLGTAEEYNGVDVTGKVVFVSRGTLNFAEKANNALARGAVGVVIYNNESGINYMDLTGLNYAAPVVSITQEEGAAIRTASEDKGTYRAGKLTVYGKMGAGVMGSEYYTMSSFSSWGVPDDLSLKPEITAPGGDIYSVYGATPWGGGSDQYVTMSGTSMAAPQVTGMSALLVQYYRENGMADKCGLSARHLAQSLLMSTATPLREENSGGHYYSILNQGAGLARVDLAANAKSYVLVKGQDDGKVKAELGDDPQRTGVYSFDFTVTNMTDTVQDYTLDAELFRQDVFEYQPGSGVWLLDTWTTDLEGEAYFTSSNLDGGEGVNYDMNGDGTTNAADADHLLEYVVGNVPKVYADGDINDDGSIDSYDAHLLLAALGGRVVTASNGQVLSSPSGEILTVPANETVTVHVELRLSAAAKAELDEKTPKGTYVEAYVYAHPVADAEGNMGTTHSIPVLAFYGDWSEPSMFDRGTFVELMYQATNMAPYLYNVVGPYGNFLSIAYADGSAYVYGGNPVVEDAVYMPQRNAFSSTNGSVMMKQTYTLIRGAGDVRVQIANADNGEVYFERLLDEQYPAYYNPSYGFWENMTQYADLNWSGTDAADQPLAEGTKVDISVTAVSRYYRQPDGSYSFEGLGAGSTMTTTMVIDNTAPVAANIDLSKVDNDRLIVKAKDNEYVAAVALLNSAGNQFYTAESPNQTERNKEVTVELDLSDIYGSKFLVAVYDYAYNYTVYEVELDLGSPDRDYFTAYDTTSGRYVSVDRQGQVTPLFDADLPSAIRAAEYVGGYVFSVTADNMLCVANDEDLSYTQCIGKLDAESQWSITGFNDLAYNYADDKLYGQFYSWKNYEAAPYLCTIDMFSGEMEVICELPEDVNTMAIDGEGNFYSAGYCTNILYTYTLEQISGNAPSMTYVGEMGYYYSNELSSMTWDHNENKLYWSFPNILLKVNPKTAEITLLGYQQELLVGLYVTPTEDEGRFDPVETLTSLKLNQSAALLLKGSTCTLEAIVCPWNSSSRAVVWTTSDASVATVDANGKVTARKDGNCVITATSQWDPSKTASCDIEVIDKTLNGLIWDEDAAIWMSEFSLSQLPEYKKLSDVDLGLGLASATIGQDGNIYAASLDMSTGKSELYQLDPNTFAPTLIGASTDGYVDLAPAPGQPGNSLMGVYLNNVMHIDAATGDYYNYYYFFENNLVALAYVGTNYDYKEWGFDTQVDWYFIIDRLGYVYLMGFLEQDGQYYYMEHDQLAPGGIYTKLDFDTDVPYYCSAYFDGEFLYYSAYKESNNNVTLMTIDVASGTKRCNVIGTFDDGVWPVAGLMELNKTELDNHIDILSTTAKPVAVEQQEEIKAIREKKAEGTLNHTIAPMSASETKDDLVYVYVTLPSDGTNADMTVSYDPQMLELADVNGMTTAFAWNRNHGQVRLSLAEAGTIPATATVARLCFHPVGQGETTVSIVTNGLGAEDCGHEERIAVSVGDSTPGTQFVDVDESAFYYDAVLWAVENGITTGYGNEYTFAPDAACTRSQVVTFLWRAAGEPETASSANPFTDIQESDYFYKAVLWAVEAGITNGYGNSYTFAPDAVCTRSQVATFLWRYFDEAAPDSNHNPFNDVAADTFYYDAVLWAVEQGITNGYGNEYTFAPEAECSRSQIVTFLYRAMN